MTLADFFETIPRFFTRLLFPVYVEDGEGNLFEVERIDFRSGCSGTVLECPALDSQEWDEDLCNLRDDIAEAWEAADYDSDAHRIFDPTANVISIERAYALLQKTEILLAAMYE